MAASDPLGDRIGFGPGVRGSGAAAGEPRGTSLPLLVLGAVLSVLAALDLTWQLPEDILRLMAAPVLTAAFAALWIVYRQRAAARGAERPTGYGAAAIICLIMSIPPLIVAVFYAGPFLPYSVGLLAAGLLRRNSFLTAWAAATGVVGVLEGFFGITNRLPLPVWAWWEHPAIYLALGVATVLAGHGDAAARAAPACGVGAQELNSARPGPGWPYSAGVEQPARDEASSADLRARLRLALAEALRKRDAIAVSALRSALSEISNAEAVAPPTAPPGTSSAHIAGAVAGLGAGEAERRVLSAEQVSRIVQAEVTERLAAAEGCEHGGHPDRARRLRSEAGVLAAVAADGGPPCPETP